jgi:NAD(P)-dependent dehydrogenase (short-subunit alcohol dehydrogenase family)
MLKGQNILVTGATGAIGQAICRALVADGARVVIHYSRNREANAALLADLGGQGACLGADLARDPKLLLPYGRRPRPWGR